MPERERERLAEQVRTAIGGAANPTQVGFGVVGIDQASDAVMSVIDSILSARNAHFEARNRMTEQSDHWRGRAEVAEAVIKRVRNICAWMPVVPGEGRSDLAGEVLDALDATEAPA